MTYFNIALLAAICAHCGYLYGTSRKTAALEYRVGEKVVETFYACRGDTGDGAHSSLVVRNKLELDINGCKAFIQVSDKELP